MIQSMILPEAESYQCFNGFTSSEFQSVYGQDSTNGEPRDIGRTESIAALVNAPFVCLAGPNSLKRSGESHGYHCQHDWTRT